MTPSGLGRFRGRTALLTAAASGIGAATAHRLAEEGARVLVTDVDGPGARRVAEQVIDKGGDSHHLALDATVPGDWAAALATALDWTGRLDVLHVNAGRNLPAAAHELDDEGWDHQLRLSLDSVFYGVRATIAALREASGAIVITSSIHAQLGFKGFPAYAAAKGGIGALVRQLAVEYGGEVRVNAILPGAIETGLWSEAPDEYRRKTSARTPVGRIGSPEEVAAVVAFLASADAAFITGQNITVDGGRSISSHE